MAKQKARIMFGRNRFWMLGSAAAILLFLGAFLFTSPSATEATLVVSEGTATIEGPANRPFNAVARRQRMVAAGETFGLQAGSTLQLSQGASAQLRFRDGSSMELTEGALLHLTELVEQDETFRVRVFLFAGRTLSRVEHLLDADDAFIISTPSSTTSVRGTVFSVQVINDAESEVDVEEGTVVVSTETESVEVHAGFRLRVRTGKPLDVEPRPEPAPTETVAATDAEDLGGKVLTREEASTATPTATDEPTPTATPGRVLSLGVVPPPDAPTGLPVPPLDPPTDAPPVVVPPTDPPSDTPPVGIPTIPPTEPLLPTDPSPTDPTQPTDPPPTEPVPTDPAPTEEPSPTDEDNQLPTHVCEGPAGPSNPNCP